MRKKALAVILLGGMTAYSGNAQFRKYANEFLNIGAGARGLGMGGAQVASAGNASSAYWNPARLSTVTDHPQLSLMHAEYFSGIGKYDFAALALPVQDNRRTIALTLLRFGIDDIPNTLFLIEPGGRPNYNNIETFSSADYAVMASMGQDIKVTDEWTLSAGGNIKIIHRNIGSFAKAWGFGIDAGIHLTHKNWQLGAVLRDASSTFNMWSFNFTEREKQALYLTRNSIPQQSSEMTAPRLLLGGAYRFEFSEKLSLQAEIQLDNTFDGKRNTLLRSKWISIDPRAGLELDVAGVFALRGGVSQFQQALKDGDTTNLKKVWIFQPALGAGFKAKQVQIDYAFTNLANQSAPLFTHIISLSVALNKKDKP